MGKEELKEFQTKIQSRSKEEQQIAWKNRIRLLQQEVRKARKKLVVTRHAAAAAARNNSSSASPEAAAIATANNPDSSETNDKERELHHHHHGLEPFDSVSHEMVVIERIVDYHLQDFTFS